MANPDATYTIQGGAVPVAERRILPAGQDATDGIPYLHFSKIGYENLKLFPIIQQRCGLQYMSPNLLFQYIFKQGKRTINSLTLQNREGSSLVSAGQVLGCITGNGTALPRVTLYVTGRLLDDGTNTGVPYWTKRGAIQNFAGRAFMIDEVENVTNGQNITVIPMDGAYDLTVSGGNCVQFPTGSNFGGGAPLGSDLEACDCSWETTRATHDFLNTKINSITTLEHSMTRKASTQQEWITGVKYDMDVQGIYQTVFAYMTQDEMEFEAQMGMLKMNQVFFGKQNQNTDIVTRCGNGLFTQIPDDLRFNYTPGGSGSDRLTYQKLKNIIAYWKIKNREYVGNELFMLCGSEFYKEVNEILDLEAKSPVYWTGANETMADTARKYYLGNNWGGFHHIFGVNISFIHFPFLDNRYIGNAQPSPVNPEPTVGRYTHTGILIDPSEMKNVNLSTMNLEKEPEYKVAFYGYVEPGNNQDLTEYDQYRDRDSKFDWMGKLNTHTAGESNCAKKIRTCNFMPNLNDDNAMMLIDIDPSTF